MSQSFWNKKIPTIVGMFLLVAGVIATSLVVQNGTNLVTKADSTAQPEHLNITNVTESSATISFTTAKASITTISYGKTQEERTQTISDSRDKGASPSERTIHHFVLDTLTPDTSYQFIVQSGGETYKADASTPFQFTTGKPVTFTNTNDHTISGKLISDSGEVAKDILIYISSDTTQAFSVLSGLDGAFSLPVQNIRSADLSQALSLTEDTVLTFRATDGKQETTAVFRFANAHPLPTMILGNKYDFSAKDILPTFVPKDSVDPSFPLNESETDPHAPQIISPKKGENLQDAQPTISGKAKGNETVTLEITGKDTLSAKVITNRQGTWTYKPTKPLSPGKNTISITSKGDSGIVKTITHSFTVLSEIVEPTPTKPAPSPTKISSAGNTSHPEPSQPPVTKSTVILAMKNSQSVLSAQDMYPTPTEMVLMSTSTLPSGLSPVMITSSITMIVMVGILSSLFLLKRDVFSL